MAVAETNKIITHGDGQSIATSIQNIADAINDQEKNVHLSDAQTISGAKTFTSPIKTPEIDNTSGNAMLRDKSTEGAIVLGSSTKKAVIMGSGDRPTYSKDGSDFTGSELALKSDVSSISDLFILADEGSWYQRFKSANIDAWNGHNVTIYDTGKITNLKEAFIYMGTSKPTNSFTFIGGKACTNVSFAFPEIHTKALTIDFDASSCSDISTLFRYLSYSGKVNVNVKNIKAGTIADQLFYNNYYLTEIPAIDLSNVTSLSQAFYSCASLTSFLATGVKVSFDLHYSTKLSQSALRVVIDNLADMSSATTKPTLTLGSTNLAKLTADDITTANNKGWNLA